MAFRLGNLVIDRVKYGLATDFNDVPKYILTQLQDATITVSTDSTDATDAQGVLIKRFYRAKKAEFKATNAMLNVSIMSAATGADIDWASESNTLVMPKIIEIPGTTKSFKLDGINTNKIDFVTVAGLGFNGVQTNAYKKGTVASATDFVVGSDGTLTLPTPTVAEDQYLIKYYRDVKAGGHILNTADKYPKTIKLTLKCIAIDPCSADTLRSIYIVMPSFQPSPDLETTFTTDANIDYSGVLQVGYCSNDKALYEIFWADDDVEDES